MGGRDQGRRARAIADHGLLRGLAIDPERAFETFRPPVMAVEAVVLPEERFRAELRQPGFLAMSR